MAYAVGDPEHRATLAATPMDLLLHARAVHALFRRTDVLRGVLDCTGIDDLDPSPRAL